jgi:hypothetical protein
VNRDLERRLRRLEQDNDPEPIRYEVSSVPLWYDENGGLRQGTIDVEPDRPLTDEEWFAEYCQGSIGSVH